jgi:TPR repeat protein
MVSLVIGGAASHDSVLATEVVGVGSQYDAPTGLDFQQEQALCLTVGVQTGEQDWTGSLNVSRREAGVAMEEADAVSWLTNAAVAGDPVAMVALCDALWKGWDMPENKAEAVLWYRKSALEGYAAGMSRLGVCLREGAGVARDEAEAASWFKRAAKAGDGMAMVDLGDALMKGEGVPEDKASAVLWYWKAAHAGRDSACLRLRRLALA